MSLLPPERGGRKPLSEHLGADTRVEGVYRLDDQSCAPPGGFAEITNARADGDMLVCRGGLSKRNSSAAVDAAVYGMIDTNGEFD